MKLFVGLITALLFSGTLLFSIENNCSLTLMTLGFLVYIIPEIFISEIKNNSRFFIALTFSIIFVYVNVKWGYYSTFIGVLLAFFVGIPIHYFVVKNARQE